jgi:hypothetical protein
MLKAAFSSPHRLAYSSQGALLYTRRTRDINAACIMHGRSLNKIMRVHAFRVVKRFGGGAIVQANTIERANGRESQCCRNWTVSKYLFDSNSGIYMKLQ